MESRKITILDSETQSKHVIETNAETFGELKQLARQAGINIEGKDWLEGFTKTSPRDDSSVLPVNVPYKGQRTNNLVYMLTNTNKKTSSGYDRKALYAEIKELNLAVKIKEAFGDNYTRLKSKVLAKFIDEHKNSKTERKEEKPTNTDTKTEEHKVCEEDIKIATAIANLIISLNIEELVDAKIKELTLVEVDLNKDVINDLFD